MKLYYNFKCFYSRLASPSEKVIRPVPETASVEGTISPTSPHGSRESLVLYVPESEEIRVSPVVSRKGYLNILEEKVNGWKKRWVVSTLY
jgi:hypothetical protein